MSYPSLITLTAVIGSTKHVAHTRTVIRFQLLHCELYWSLQLRGSLQAPPNQLRIFMYSEPYIFYPSIQIRLDLIYRLLRQPCS